MMVHPSFGPPVDLPRQADLFVLMPFQADLTPVYRDHISSVAKSLDLTVMRADDLFTNNSVMSDVWSGIMGAGTIIADCTGRNPNVFYEIGIAHTIGKPVILMTQSSEDIPIDLRHMKYLRYEFTPRGMKEFEEMLAETITNIIGWWYRKPH